MHAVYWVRAVWDTTRKTLAPHTTHTYNERTQHTGAHMYNADSTEVVEFVAAFQRVKGYNYPLSTTQTPKYVRVDRDGSGVFLIERSSGRVYNVQGYGKRGSQAGTLANLTSAYAYSQRMAVVK